MKTIYISGPMTGLLALNKPAFDAEAARLRMLGYTVMNPAEVSLPVSATWHDYMRADIPLLCQCDAIVMLDGWTASRGAVIEHRIALELGMVVHASSFITWQADDPFGEEDAAALVKSIARGRAKRAAA